MQMRAVVKLALVAFALVATTVRSDDSEEFEGEFEAPKKKAKSKVFVLEHSFSSDPQGFKPRSKFEVSIAAETKFANAPGGAAEKKGEKQATVLDMESYTFPPDEVKVFQELVNNGGYYRVRCDLTRRWRIPHT